MRIRRKILENHPFWIKGGKAVSGKLSGSNCLSTLPASLPFHSSTGFIFSFRWSCTCVNSSIEIPLSLKCKILQYKIIWQLPMEVQDFFYLCKIYHPAWIQVDRRNVQQSELWLYRPLYHKTGKHALRCEIILWQISFRVFIEPSTNQDWLNCLFLLIQTKKNCCQCEINKLFMNQVLDTAI